MTNEQDRTIPQPVEPPVFFTPVPEETEEVEEVEPEIVSPTKQRDELADLFEVPQPEDNDMETADLFEVTDEYVMGGDTDLSDLVDVSNEDIMGSKDLIPGAPASNDVDLQRRKVTRFRRTGKRYIPPPGTTVRGIRG